MDGISAILLAAGESTRMGRLKALLPWQGVTLVEYQVQSLQRAGVAEVVMVVGHRGGEVEAPVKGMPGVTTVVNPDYKQGKTTSIKAGLRNISSSAVGILVLAVDQPRPAQVVESVIKAHLEQGALVTYPVYSGHGGHPIVFSASLLPKLLAITEGGQGLREVTLRHRESTYKLQVDSPIVTVDVNSPEDLQEALTLFERR
ncbi:MAG: nucleotidyltransferase family protein [Dehalococcoidia bacterium]|jgi:molybdenum cofactor cytidylyltransferase|nr:nucleotidyltransferase family protein [Dehalococcoidia bacterium]